MHETGSVIDRDRIQAEWAARGFSCDLWIDPPARGRQAFIYDTDELALHLIGE